MHSVRRDNNLMIKVPNSGGEVIQSEKYVQDHCKHPVVASRIHIAGPGVNGGTMS